MGETDQLNFGHVTKTIFDLIKDTPIAPFVPVGWNATIQINTCGHYAHTNCLGRIVDTCPLCRSFTNALIPVVDFEKPPEVAASSLVDYIQNYFKERDVFILVDEFRGIYTFRNIDEKRFLDL